MHNVDEVLGDLDLNISAGVRASHWLNPINPAAYRGVTPALLKRLAASATAPPAPPAPPAAAATASIVETPEPARTETSQMLS
jgi:hypothetical protein